jgi:hypothetical protein
METRVLGILERGKTTVPIRTRKMGKLEGGDLSTVTTSKKTATALHLDLQPDNTGAHRLITRYKDIGLMASLISPASTELVVLAY